MFDSGASRFCINALSAATMDGLMTGARASAATLPLQISPSCVERYIRGRRLQTRKHNMLSATDAVERSIRERAMAVQRTRTDAHLKCVRHKAEWCDQARRRLKRGADSARSCHGSRIGHLIGTVHACSTASSDSSAFAVFAVKMHAASAFEIEPLLLLGGGRGLHASLPSPGGVCALGSASTSTGSSSDKRSRSGRCQNRARRLRCGGIAPSSDDLGDGRPNECRPRVVVASRVRVPSERCAGNVGLALGIQPLL